MAISPVALNALLQTTALQPLIGARLRPVDLLLPQLLGTTVSLSSFGRLQSVVAGVADAAAGLRGNRAGNTAAIEAPQLRGALERFVAAANTAGRVSENVLFTRLFSGGVVFIDDTDALLATGEILRSVDDPARNGGVEFSRLGVTRQPDGQLRLDAQAFDAAFAADPEGVVQALDNLGEAVATSAARELGAGGRLNAAAASFDLLLATLQLQSLGGIFGGAGSVTDASSALLLNSNPFLFRGVNAFQLIAGL